MAMAERETDRSGTRRSAQAGDDDDAFGVQAISLQLERSTRTRETTGCGAGKGRAKFTPVMHGGCVQVN